MHKWTLFKLTLDAAIAVLRANLTILKRTLDAAIAVLRTKMDHAETNLDAAIAVLRAKKKENFGTILMHLVTPLFTGYRPPSLHKRLGGGNSPGTPPGGIPVSHGGKFAFFRQFNIIETF